MEGEDTPLLNDSTLLQQQLHPHQLTNRAFRLIFTALFLSIFLAALDATIVATILTRIGSDFGMSNGKPLYSSLCITTFLHAN